MSETSEVESLKEIDKTKAKIITTKNKTIDPLVVFIYLLFLFNFVVGFALGITSVTSSNYVSGSVNLLYMCFSVLLNCCCSIYSLNYFKEKIKIVLSNLIIFSICISPYVIIYLVIPF